MVIQSLTRGVAYRSQGSGMTPKELSENDDLATGLVLDPYLGFTTHKMNLRYILCDLLCINRHRTNIRLAFLAYQSYSYRPPKTNREELKQAVIKFIQDQDYQKAYEQLTSNDYVWNILANKTKQQQAVLREHVRKDLYLSLFKLSSNDINCRYSDT